MPAGSTYTPIATATGNGSGNTITFTSIPSTYTDLIVVMTYQNVSGGAYVSMRINNDSGSNYSFTQLYGTGSAAGSARSSNQTEITFESDPTTPNLGNGIFQFQNYANTSVNKTWLMRTNVASDVTRAMVGLYRSTSAINRLDFYDLGGSRAFTSGTVFTLYGLAAA